MKSFKNYGFAFVKKDGRNVFKTWHTYSKTNIIGLFLKKKKKEEVRSKNFELLNINVPLENTKRC